MSDDNYRKPSSPRATRIGLGLTGANSGLAEVESDTRYMDPPSETHGVEREEIVRRLREDTEASTARSIAPKPTGAQGLFGSTLRAHTAPRAAVHAPVYDEDVQPQRNEEADDYDMADPDLFRAALDHTVRAQPVAAQPVTTRPPPPPSGSRAPEAWRDEVRRMVERAPSKGPTSSPAGASNPSSQSPGGMGGYGGPNAPGGASLPPSNKPSLRLKLDADAVEESYRAPKSALPKLLTWLVVLALIGGGFWLFAESRGGVAALIQQLSGAQPTVTTTQEPTAPVVAPTADPAAAAQQPAAAAPAAPTSAAAPSGTPAAPSGTPAAPSGTPAAPTAAAPSSAPKAAAPAAPAAAPSAPKAPAPAPKAQPQAPSTPKAEPEPTENTAAAPQAEDNGAEPAPSVAPKPAAAPKAPARQVKPQQPVVKVRPIESAPSSPEPSAPDPLDIPYVPLPGDPPAPDEAR